MHSVRRSTAHSLQLISLEGESATPEQVKRLEDLCRRTGVPMLAQPHTRMRVIAYTNALNRRPR